MRDCFVWSSERKADSVSVRRADIAGRESVGVNARRDRLVEHTCHEFLTTLGNFANRVFIQPSDLAAGLDIQ